MSFVLSSYAIKILCKFSKPIDALKKKKLHKQILPQAGSELDTWNSILHVNFAVNFTLSEKNKKVNTNNAFLRRYTLI